MLCMLKEFKVTTITRGAHIGRNENTMIFWSLKETGRIYTLEIGVKHILMEFRDRALPLMLDKINLMFLTKRMEFHTKNI